MCRPSARGRPVVTLAAPLVGRRRELAALDGLLAGVADGGPVRPVVIRGPAGIGKSRLAEEVVAAATRLGFTLGQGRCWPHGGAPPLWPWHDVLETITGASAAALLDERLGGPAVDPERFARFRAVAEAVASASADGPVLVVLDDMHAADAGAVLLARFLARSPRLRRLAVVVTHREPIPPGEWVTNALRGLESDASVIDLHGLSQADVSEMASGLGRPLDDAEAAAVRRATGGNPLLVEQLIAADAVSPLGEDSAPVRRTILGRLQNVSAETRNLLDAAAVLGPQASIDELAAVCDAPVPAVLAARAEAAATGLTDPDDPAIRFQHDAFREAVLAELDVDRMVTLNARAASLLAVSRSVRTPAGEALRPEAEALVRWANHAMASASSAPEAATVAIEACRRAAEGMMHGFAYEAAAELLQSAVALADAQPPGEGESGVNRAELYVELARATIATGALAEARPWFLRAAEMAERQGDARLTAEAALGLGGIWVYEHRLLDEQERYLALLGRALDALGDAHPDLAARLHVRLNAERVYFGTASVAEVEEAVAEVRATGDLRGLAEALSLEHHVKLGPAYSGERLELAAELVRTASAAGDGVLTLMGLVWRTVDLYLSGRPEADRSLAELRQRAEALGVEAVQLVVGNIDVMRLLRAGQLDEAEQAAGDVLQIGDRIGDADAVAWYGGQLLARRWFEGRAASLLPLAQELSQSPTLAVPNHVFSAAWAALSAEAGRHDEARMTLDRIRDDRGFAGIAQSSALLVTLFGVIEATAAIGDGSMAAEAYEALSPYADMPIMGSIAVVCFGSVERSLGVAARVSGRRDLAIEHFERAVTANRRLANRPMYAIAQADLAGELIDRDLPGDRQRAATLLAGAIEIGEALGLEARVSGWRERHDGLSGPSTPDVGRLVQMGDHWELEACGERAVVPNTLGVQYVARLLGQPGRPVTVGELTGRSAGETRQDVIDDAARDAYRRHITELRAGIDEADADADLERAAGLRIELDALMDELRRVLRPGGRSRAFAGSDERARTSVQKAIRRTLDRLAVDAPHAAEGLRRTIRTGTDCVFEPDDEVTIPSVWVVS